MPDEGDFRLVCPRCKAPPEQAKLRVVSGSFAARDMFLNKDGFSPTDSKGFDTHEEMVSCSACRTLFPLYECMTEDLSHVETVEFTPLEQVNEGRLECTTHILDVYMHVIFLRVKENANHIQVVDGHPLAHKMYDKLCEIDPGGPFQTVQIEGHEGEWVMILTPFQR
jgi:hypothetical protein